jgi:serine/threonine protein kinase
VPLPGTLIEGKYEILSKIKEGGMGTIYKVRHRLLEEVRVVKVMRPQMLGDEDLKRRFTQEAKTATRLKHPNIGAILDFALDSQGQAYIVMEFIDGVNLAELMRTTGPPDLPLAVEIAHQSLLALAYLHRKGIIHRDVAPDNLMLTRDEEGRPQIKLIDLGIAKAVDKTIELTSTGVFLGKVKYSSPEQLGGLEKGETLDSRSDLYSLGIVLYELLTGKRPILGETPRELFAGHLFQQPVPFSETDPSRRVPERLRAIVLKALEKKRDDRFATAEEFDREIVVLRSRLGGGTDPEGTQRILSRVRATPPPPAEGVTPSAQDRLDHQFLAHSTPTPSATSVKGLTVVPGETADPNAPTVVDARAAQRLEAAAPPLKTAPTRRIPPLAVAATLVALVAAGLLLWRALTPSDAERPRTLPATPEPSGPRVAVAATPFGEPTAIPEVPTAEPADAVPTPSVDTAALRRAAEAAQVHATSTRRLAERAGAPRSVEGLYTYARTKEREAQRLFARGDYPAAHAAFEAAAAGYGQAETWARNALERRPTPVERAAVQPTIAIPRSEPTRAPTSVLLPTEPPRPTPRPVETARPALTEEDRVRDAIERYVRAQNTLDVDLYASVYPALQGERRAMVASAFANLRSQNLEFDVQRIEINGPQAVVRGFERRLAVPRIGSEQRDSRERVLRLERRGEGWIITSLSN